MIVEFIKSILHFLRIGEAQQAEQRSPKPKDVGSSPTPFANWYNEMVKITGTHEVSGAGDNPAIMSWPAFIAKTYPEMAAYCRAYTHDSIPWCGLTVAYVLAKAGFRPQFGSTDTKRFLFARSWAEYGVPLTKGKKGAILVFTRDGGGHVSLYESEDANYYYVRGGNQSDQVNVMRYPKSRLLAIRWPHA